MEARSLDPIRQFEQERKERIAGYESDTPLKEASRAFLAETLRAKYSYNFTWLGRPVIQHPQDMMALQEIIWAVKPDLIIETGIAHGGSLIFHASMLELLGEGHVLGIDIDIRPHNRAEIEKHPMFKRITMLEGSSVDEEMVRRVRSIASDYKKVLVILDSNHTHDHVLGELRGYSPLVPPGSYLVVYDGIIELIPESTREDRPWGPGNNPFTATRQFLEEHPEFEVDRELESKLLVTAAPSGYLKRTR